MKNKKLMRKNINILQNTKRVVLFDLATSGHHIYYAFYLIRYLCEKGYQVMFVTLKADDKIKLLSQDEPNLTVQYIDDNVSYELIGGNIVRKYAQILNMHVITIRGLKKCFQLANDWKADVIQILDLNYNTIPLYIIESMKWRKHSYRIFGIMVAPYFIHHQGESILKKFYYNIEMRVLKRIIKKGVLSKLFVHTTEIKNLLFTRFGWYNCHQEDIIVVPDPTEMLYGNCSIIEARKRLQLPNNIPLLLFFGGLRKDKGPDILLEAIKSIKQDFRLIIAGLPEDTTRSDVEAYQKQLDDPEKIIARLEYIPDDEINYYFLCADAVVLPYRKNFKGTSGVLQLATAAGKPVIATNVGQIGKIVKEHSLGIVVKAESPDDLKEGIQKFLRDRQSIINTILPNALKYAKKNHWREFASLIEAAYL